MKTRDCVECGKGFPWRPKTIRCSDCRLVGYERDVVSQMANNRARWDSGWGINDNSWGRSDDD